MAAPAPSTTAPSTTEAKPVALNTAYYITQCLARSVGFAEKLLTDIPADKFAWCAVKGASHPAFVVGHLCLYPNRVFTLIGRTDLVVDRPGWPELFQAGAPCLDDASKYPSKAELIQVFNDGWNKVLETLPTVADGVLARDNPIEGRFREIFPKVGTAVMFLCTSHMMMHLGQISTWRRAIGLGSAM
jgi:hypothetical protein